MPDATYYKTTDATGVDTFHCCYCDAAGQGHHATDPALFAQHMEQRHDGRLVEGPVPESAVVDPLVVHPPDAPPPASQPQTSQAPSSQPSAAQSSGRAVPPPAEEGVRE